MELKYVNNKKLQKAYLSLPKKIYKDDINYRNLNEYIIKQLFKGKTPFCKDKLILPIIITNNDEVVLECFFIYTNQLDGLLQISFFEAVENVDSAVKLMIEEAKKIALKHGLKKIVVGLNGHVNYGLGILKNHFDHVPTFGTSYNKPYYQDYFTKLGLKEIELVSYKWDMKLPKMKKYERLINRITKSYTLKILDLKNLKRDVEIYNELNIKCFNGHRYYYPTSIEEDYTLIKELLLFTKKELIIFAYDNENPVGFIMWYPDFNQILKMGEKLGVKAYLKNKLFSSKIKKVKVAEIAVLPQYQGKGLSLILLKEAIKVTKGQYNEGESSWILKENSDSTNLSTSLVDQEYKQYGVYELDL